MECETVRIVSPVSDDNPLGYIVINKSDLTDAHELFVEAAADESDAPGPDGTVVRIKRKYTKSADAQ